MDLTKIFSGMDKGPEAIQANLEKLKDFANATAVSIDHTTSIVPAVGKLGNGRNQADMIKVGTTLSIFMINFSLLEFPSFNEWQYITLASIPKSFLNGATHAIKMNPGQVLTESKGNNGFSSYDYDLDTSTGKINMYARSRYPHDSGSPTEVGAYGIWLLY